jgi:hypothetical protein
LKEEKELERSGRRIFEGQQEASTAAAEGCRHK